MKLSKSKLLRAFALAAAFAGATVGAYSYAIEPNGLKTTSYAVDSPKWPEDMPPLRIAMASDLHVGSPPVSLKKLETIVERLNGLQADIIVLPGDFVTEIGNSNFLRGEYVEPAQIAAVLKNLKAPLGVYAVLGNHEVAADPAGMRAALEKAGIRVLENDAVHVVSGQYNFWVAGLSGDLKKQSWRKTAQKITDKAPVILVVHDPDAFRQRNNRPVVTLAGHTHGGQVNLPIGDAWLRGFFGYEPERYNYGHISEDGRDLIVTSGIGTSTLPLRFRAPPEIVKIKIGR